VTSGIEAGYWRDVIGAEYDSLPRLSLTVAQAMRLWSIDEDISRRVLDSYVESGYLEVASDGQYRRADVATATAASGAAVLPDASRQGGPLVVAATAGRGGEAKARTFPARP
jgi:hypothetical protein